MQILNRENEGTKTKLIYPELSYRIVGAAFEVFNRLGPGLQEKTYQKALSEELKHQRLSFKEQARVLVKFRNRAVGTYFLDFLVDEKLIVELKCGDYFSHAHIIQVVNYLKITGYKLAILLNFTRDGIRQKRIINTEELPVKNSDIRSH